MELRENMFLSQYDEDLKTIYDLIIKDHTTGTAFCEDVIEVLPQISIALGHDFETANVYFKLDNDYVPLEVNMRQLSFQEFKYLLQLFLIDEGKFHNQFSLRWIKKSKKQILSFFLEFTSQKKQIPLNLLEDLFVYIITKTAKRDFIRNASKRRNFSFYRLLEQSLEEGSKCFKNYMLFLKKNQKFLTFSDFIRIGTQFRIFNFPVDSELPSLEHIEGKIVKNNFKKKKKISKF